MRMTKEHIMKFAAASFILLGLCITGCDQKLSFEKKTNYISPERADKGVVYILPGIEGESSANHHIRSGLNKGGIDEALVIYNWGFPLPGIGLLVNQTNVAGNRKSAAKLAEEIFEYQQKYPGRPVYIIGHSGGGGVAIFTLEALSKIQGAKPVEGVFLLSASLSANYDLSRALRMTRKGIVNCSNPDDIALLKTGTSIFGNVDGGKGSSCGRVGFTRRWPKVWEIRLRTKEGKAIDPHYVFTREDTIAMGAPKWLLAETWPPEYTTHVVAGAKPAPKPVKAEVAAPLPTAQTDKTSAEELAKDDSAKSAATSPAPIRRPAQTSAEKPRTNYAYEITDEEILED